MRHAQRYNYRNRMYSAEWSRFLQPDPIGFQAGDINIYRYVGNNPVNWVDSDGLTAQGATIGGSIGGAVGGWIGGTAGVTAGAAGGSLVAPGAGTVAGGVGGAIEGFGLGAAAGALLGGMIGDLISNAVENTGRPGSTLPGKSTPNDSQAEDRGDGKGTIRDYDGKGNPETDYDFGHEIIQVSAILMRMIGKKGSVVSQEN